MRPRSGPVRRTQRQRVLDLLIARAGHDVPSVELSRISLQYGSRVKELRGLGFKIINRTERHDGIVHGFFRLELGMAKPIDEKSPPLVAADCLFPEPTDVGALGL